ncbi:MAG: RNA 2',3'-cyclic phosphodiesterase [Deltaproteobacteria bacterium]|nr:RNA 2',3'-cyclic phosphodiesterase [Deltaproteobacteria bacterium]
MRVFIAAFIPQEIKFEIGRYVDEIKSHWEGVKWESYEKLHVTLKFLGEVEESKVEEIGNNIREAASIYSPFDMEIARFGGFPNLKNPRVLFIGLTGDQELLKLQSEIEERLEGLGFTKDDRSFFPHITVGRIRGKARLKGSFPVPRRIPFFISEIAVMKSVLNPGGSKYAPISVFQLDKLGEE